LNHLAYAARPPLNYCRVKRRGNRGVTRKS
jgi:hypothetical protein